LEPEQFFRATCRRLKYGALGFVRVGSEIVTLNARPHPDKYVIATGLPQNEGTTGAPYTWVAAGHMCEFYRAIQQINLHHAT
jgi:hypothetical protein